MTRLPRPDHRLAAPFALILALGAGLLTSCVSALFVLNPGFEDLTGETPANEFTFGPLSGWDLYDPLGIAGGGAGGTYFIGTLTPVEPDPVGNPGVFSFFPEGAPQGDRVGIAFNFAGSGGEGEYGFQQTLAATLQPNRTYTLRVAVGNIDSGVSSSGQFFDLAGFPGYRIDLLAGGTVLAQDDNTLASVLGEGEFGTSVVTFTTGAAPPLEGQPLGIRLVNLNQVDPAFPGSDLEVDFDDVRLSSAPAP
ncbi:MAG: hypothetical protein QNK05_06510 [Myxococcota bacterium]|nr:hypothetical protein [Myxococcota bacterium]